jgi:hypothetical protein
MRSPDSPDAINATYGADHFAFVGFNPHAAVGDPAPMPANPEAFATERPIPIMFPGSFYGPDQPFWKNFSPDLRSLFDDAYEIALSCEWTPVLDALRQALLARGVDPAAPHLQEVRKGATFIHEQVRRRRRLHLLEVADAIGIPLYVVGTGYEGQLHRLRNIVHGGTGDLNAIAKLMTLSRVVLNINANFGAGSHERPLTAMMAGAVAASDYSTYYADCMREDQEILLYRWMALPEGLEAIARIAADPDSAYAIALAGQARVKAEHQWDNRIDNILNAAQSARSRALAASGPLGERPRRKI